MVAAVRLGKLTRDVAIDLIAHGCPDQRDSVGGRRYEPRYLIDQSFITGRVSKQIPAARAKEAPYHGGRATRHLPQSRRKCELYNFVTRDGLQNDPFVLTGPISSHLLAFIFKHNCHLLCFARSAAHRTRTAWPFALTAAPVFRRLPNRPRWGRRQGGRVPARTPGSRRS